MSWHWSCWHHPLITKVLKSRDQTDMEAKTRQQNHHHRPEKYCRQTPKKYFEALLRSDIKIQKHVKINSRNVYCIQAPIHVKEIPVVDFEVFWSITEKRDLNTKHVKINSGKVYCIHVKINSSKVYCIQTPIYFPALPPANTGYSSVCLAPAAPPQRSNSMPSVGPSMVLDTVSSSVRSCFCIVIVSFFLNHGLHKVRFSR